MPGLATLEYKAISTAAPRPDVGTSVGEEGVVEALVAVTGVPDNVGDVIVPGAFRETLAVRKPKGVFSHDTTTWVARTEVVEELMPGDPRLPKTTKDGRPWPRQAGALYVKARFNLRSDDGRNAYENVRFFSETDECEWSIGYKVPKGGARRGPDGLRYIHRLDLYEYSPVLFGAASQSMTLSVKAGVPGVADTPSDRAAVRRLKRWYVRGGGAARIRWGQPGDFMRCVRIASKHMSPERARGFCNLRHQEALGVPPGKEHKTRFVDDEDLGNLLKKADPDTSGGGGGTLRFAGRVRKRIKTRPGERPWGLLPSPGDAAAADGELDEPDEATAAGAGAGAAGDTPDVPGAPDVPDGVAGDEPDAGVGDGDEDEDEDEAAGMETKRDARIELLRAAGVDIPLSLEEILARIGRAVEKYFGAHDIPVRVEATYPDTVLVSTYSCDCTVYQVPYEMDDAGNVTLGRPILVTPGDGPGVDRQDVGREIGEVVAELEEMLESKAAGHVIGQRTARKLRSAVETLVSLLREAGIEIGGVETPPWVDRNKQVDPLPPEPPVIPDSTSVSALPVEMR